VRIFSQRCGQETMGGPAGPPPPLYFYPAAKIGDTVGDLHHATISVSNGMKFDVSVERHTLNVCLQPNKA
jgi:hypothetical protein